MEEAIIASFRQQNISNKYHVDYEIYIEKQKYTTRKLCKDATIEHLTNQLIISNSNNPHRNDSPAKEIVNIEM